MREKLSREHEEKHTLSTNKTQQITVNEAAGSIIRQYNRNFSLTELIAEHLQLTLNRK